MRSLFLDGFTFLDFKWFVKRLWMPTEKALYKLFIIKIIVITIIVIITIKTKGSTCVLEEKCPTYANNNKIETHNKEILDRKEISNCSMNVQTPMQL